MADERVLSPLIAAVEEEILDSVLEESNEDIRWLRQQRLDNDLLPWHKRPSTFMISAVFLSFTTVVTAPAASTMMLLVDQVCSSILKDTKQEICDSKTAQEMISNYQMYSAIIGGILATIAAGKIGKYSDIHGRKPMIIMIVSFYLVGLSSKTYFLQPGKTFNFAGLLLSDAIEQCVGGVLTILSLGQSYVTDVTESEHRTSSMGFVMAMMFGGLSFGPLLGNLLLSAQGSNLFVLQFSIGFGVFFLLLVALFLPESRSDMARRKSRSKSITSKAAGETLWQRANLLEPLKILWLPKSRARYIVLCLIVMDSVIMLAVASGRVIILYATFKFHWNTVDLGYFMTLGGSTRAFMLLVISPVLIRYLRSLFVVHKDKIDKVDYTVILLSLIFEAIGGYFSLLANTSRLFFCSTVFQSLGAIVAPSIHATLVKYYEDHRSGELFGALSIVKNFINCVVPPLYLLIYSHTLDYWNKFVLFIVCVIFTCNLFVVMIVRYLMEDDESRPGVVRIDVEDIDPLLEES